MPAKRRQPKKRANAITPEAVEAYAAGDWSLLHRLLGLKPWEASPLDVESLSNTGVRAGSPYAESIPKAAKLAKYLREA